MVHLRRRRSYAKGGIFFARFKSSEDEGTEIAQVPTEEILTIECNQRGARKSCSVTREVEEIEEVAE